MALSGRVVRVSCQNFMTFEALTYNPGESLNFIIGLNGAGKSSIFCAIILGLGGKPATVKRADKISSFIKYGCQKGVVEIELYNNDGENYVIKREFFKDNTSSWWLNGTIVKVKVIDDIIAKLNIQINNLCQFLPQDRVADFAKMKSVELLENTEKAVGSPEMYESHAILKEKTKEIRDNNQTIQTLLRNLEEEKQKKDALHEKVKNHLEKEGLINKIKNIENKIHINNYNAAKTELSKSMKELNVRKAKKAKVEKEKQPFEKNIKGIKTLATSSIQKFESYQNQAGTLFKKIIKSNQELECNSIKIVNYHQELVGKKKDESLRLKRIAEAESKLQEKIKAHQTMMEKKPFIISKITDKKCHIDTLNEEISNANIKIHTLEEEISRLKSQKYRQSELLSNLMKQGEAKLEILRTKNLDAYNALVWLKTNNHLFTKTIHEPLLLVLEPKHTDDAKYLESIISYNDMFAFVCEDAKDLSLFMKNVRDQQNLRINCVLAPEKPASFFKSDVQIQQISSMGFSSYIKDLFDAPDSIMAYLCQQYKIHNIPVGDQNADKHVDEMFNLGFKKIYVSESLYTVKVSKYGAHTKSIMNSKISSVSRFLKTSMPHERVKQLEEDINKKMRSIEEKQLIVNKLKLELEALNVQQKNHLEEQCSLNAQLDEIEASSTRISREKNHINIMKNETIDVKMEEKKYQQNVANLVSEHIKTITVIKSNYEVALKNLSNQNKFSSYFSFIKKKKKSNEDHIKSINDRINEINEEISNVKEVTLEKGALAKNLLTIAQEKVGYDLSKPLPPTLQKAFSELPNDTSELEKLLFEEQAKIDCFTETDEQSIAQYQAHGKEMNRLELSLQTLKSKNDDMLNEVEQIKNTWLPSLQNLIDRIDRKFKYFMKLLGCSGEIALSYGEDADDFSLYGISIRVKFRANEQLMELTSTYQSGGERSVTTIIYMMSLQELTKVPFRCLDEINQGMDPINEKRVYELVGEISNIKSSQYFLITPKLLPGLKYSNTTTILILNPSNSANNFTPKDELSYLETVQKNK